MDTGLALRLRHMLVLWERRLGTILTNLAGLAEAGAPRPGARRARYRP